MHRIKKPARLGFAAALLALLLTPLALGMQSAQAQGGPNVAAYYGSGLMAGDVVTASVDGETCAETTANAAGEWLLQVAQGACGGRANDGATVNFAVNGAMAEQTEMWRGGGVPADPAGISLTVAAMAEPTPEATPDVPAAPDTGNAGLVTSESGSPLSALALGLLAIVGLAGARAATARERSS